MRRYTPQLLYTLAVSTVSLGSAVQGQESNVAEPRPFATASADQLLDAVVTCEANKAGQTFDMAGIRKSGWRRLSPTGAMPTEQTMFGKSRNGASLSIAPDDVGPNRACIVIGWVDDKDAASSARDRIARKLGLTLQVESQHQARAEADGWDYTFLAFTKPQVTDQTRVLFLITPAHDAPASKGN